MPYRNGKGPLGNGPLTGRGYGPCEGDRTGLNFTGFGFRRNQGGYGGGRRGRGRGFGYGAFGGRLNPRAWFNTGPWFTNSSDQKTSLKNYREALEKELEDIKKKEENLK